MPKRQTVSVVQAAVLAQRLLDLWMTKNDEGLERELKQVLRQTRFATTGTATPSIESERQELIREIAERMDREREPWSAPIQAPRFQVWINLLRHLATCDSGSSSKAAGQAN